MCLPPTDENFPKYMQSFAVFAEQGSPTPGLMHLMTFLSKPFRHLEKYPAATQEIEQHLEDDHPDRGDTQRSIGFYKSVAVSSEREMTQATRVDIENYK